jgi:hypothetical protein
MTAVWYIFLALHYLYLLDICSGFFSVQVIDDALHRLGLRIIRWRSEEMKSMHDYPEWVHNLFF